MRRKPKQAYDAETSSDEDADTGRRKIAKRRQHRDDGDDDQNESGSTLSQRRKKPYSRDRTEKEEMLLPLDPGVSQNDQQAGEAKTAGHSSGSELSYSQFTPAEHVLSRAQRKPRAEWQGWDEDDSLDQLSAKEMKEQRIWRGKQLEEREERRKARELAERTWNSKQYSDFLGAPGAAENIALDNTSVLQPGFEDDIWGTNGEPWFADAAEPVLDIFMPEPVDWMTQDVPGTLAQSLPVGTNTQHVSAQSLPVGTNAQHVSAQTIPWDTDTHHTPAQSLPMDANTTHISAHNVPVHTNTGHTPAQNLPVHINPPQRPAQSLAAGTSPLRSNAAAAARPSRRVTGTTKPSTAAKSRAKKGSQSASRIHTRNNDKYEISILRKYQLNPYCGHKENSLKGSLQSIPAPPVPWCDQEQKSTSATLYMEYLANSVYTICYATINFATIPPNIFLDGKKQLLQQSRLEINSRESFKPFFSTLVDTDAAGTYRRNFHRYVWERRKHIVSSEWNIWISNSSIQFSWEGSTLVMRPPPMCRSTKMATWGASVWRINAGGTGLDSACQHVNIADNEVRHTPAVQLKVHDMDGRRDYVVTVTVVVFQGNSDVVLTYGPYIVYSRPHNETGQIFRDFDATSAECFVRSNRPVDPVKARLQKLGRTGSELRSGSREDDQHAVDDDGGVANAQVPSNVGNPAHASQQSPDSINVASSSLDIMTSSSGNVIADIPASSEIHTTPSTTADTESMHVGLMRDTTTCLNNFLQLLSDSYRTLLPYPYCNVEPSQGLMNVHGTMSNVGNNLDVEMCEQLSKHDRTVHAPYLEFAVSHELQTIYGYVVSQTQFYPMYIDIQPEKQAHRVHPIHRTHNGPDW